MEKRKGYFVLSTLPLGPGHTTLLSFGKPFEGSFPTGGGVNLENDSDPLYILFKVSL